MTTQLQTMHIQFPKSSIEAQGLEECPICPVDWSTAPVRIASKTCITTWNPFSSVEYTCVDGSQMTLPPCKTVRQVFTDGAIKTWLAKPTIEDAVKYSSSAPGKTMKCGFFQFHTDGSVESRSYGSTWYWGPSKYGLPHAGTMCRDTDESVLDDVVCCENPYCLCDSSPPLTIIPKHEAAAEPSMRYSFWTAPE